MTRVGRYRMTRVRNGVQNKKGTIIRYYNNAVKIGNLKNVDNRGILFAISAQNP